MIEERGAMDNGTCDNGDNRVNLWNRLQGLVTRFIEKAADRIVDRERGTFTPSSRRAHETMSGALCETDFGYESQRTHTIRKYYAWSIGTSFIGNEEYYQRLRDALRQKGFQYTAIYFTTTEDVQQRIKSLNEVSRQMASWEKRQAH